MESLFQDLCEGLQQAIDYEKGIGEAQKTTYVIASVKKEGIVFCKSGMICKRYTGSFIDK